jgi:hypothetical protein
MHGYFRCPCGTEFGGMTDHPQTERYCEAHATGTGLIAGVLPKYAPGRLEMAQESFDDGVGLRIEKGLPVPEEILRDRKARGLSLPEGWRDAQVETSEVSVPATAEEVSHGDSGSGEASVPGGDGVRNHPGKRSKRSV